MESERRLRSTKQRETRARILANAVTLFRKHGVRSARLSDVARDSAVSPATLFNYFSTKGQLAEAWVRGEVESTLIRFVEDSASRDRSLRSAIREACRSLAVSSCSEPALRHQAWREAGRASGSSSVGRRPLLTGLQGEQERERVRNDLPAADLADMLIEAIEGGLIAGLASYDPDLMDARQPMTDEALESHVSQKIQSRVDLILDGARKRNERVSLSRRPA